jgi:hypothetical protein
MEPLRGGKAMGDDRPEKANANYKKASPKWGGLGSV